ncbi:hypothetical protein BJY52DRAFT_1256791 [Lactarius psammicola]|nr:hypothetical protein BJY52DRAFT_1256791 [Lactarius psammicola]
MSNNVTPPRLPRRSSIWSILRSLETLSSPPSWSSLDSLATHSQVGSIPLLFRDGGEDSPDSISYLRFDAEQDVSLRHFSTISLLDHTLELEVRSIKDDNTGPASLTRNSMSLELKDLQTTSPNAPINGSTAHPTPLVMRRPRSPMIMDSCTYREFSLPRSSSQPSSLQEETHPVGVVTVTPPHAPPVLSKPEPAPQLHGGSSTTPIGAHSSSLDACRSSLATGGPSPTKGSHLHGHDGSTSIRPNLPLATHDGVHTFSETLDVDHSGRFPLLPQSLSWIKSTVLELMIDQEGFRMIQPTFRLAGYSRPPAMENGDTSPDLQLISATADFMPAERKSFAFHHASLDTPPVFRRLLVNGDESHDYLSRQAYLILKANGPYTVQGTEPVQSSRFFSNAEPPVLTWRFDYLVGDRRTEAGRIIPGEKTLTPLSFSCSPGLLQPTQARKIRVVHVVKKSVAPKLTAIKMEPPAPLRRHPVPRLVPMHVTFEHQEINTTHLTDLPS